MRNIIILVSITIFLTTCKNNNRHNVEEKVNSPTLEDIAKLYIYSSSYGETLSFMSSYSGERMNSYLAKFNLHKHSSVSQGDSIIFYFYPTLEGEEYFSDSKADMNVVFKNTKAVGLGSNNGYAFFSENEQFCEYLNKNIQTMVKDISKNPNQFSNWIKQNYKNFNLWIKMNNCN